MKQSSFCIQNQRTKICKIKSSQRRSCVNYYSNPKSSSKVEQLGAPNFWLYAQCGWDRAAWWRRWMKIQPAVNDVTPASLVWRRWMKHTSKNKVRCARLFYLTRWLWNASIKVVGKQVRVSSSVIRLLSYYLNVVPFRTIKICPKVWNICQSRLTILHKY